MPKWIIQERRIPPQYWGMYGADTGWTTNKGLAIRYDTEPHAQAVIDSYKLPVAFVCQFETKGQT